MALKKQSGSEWGGLVFEWGGTNCWFMSDPPIPIMEIEPDLYNFWEGNRDCIPESVKVKLAVPNTSRVSCPEVAERVGGRSIKFHSFIITMRFEFPMSKYWREVMFWMDCSPAQLTPNAYRAIIFFEKMTKYFDLHLTVAEFFFFFRVRRDRKHAQLKAKNGLFDFMPKWEHKWKKVTLLIFYD